MLLSLQTLAIFCHFPFANKLILTQSISLPPGLSVWYKFRSLHLYNSQPNALELGVQGTYNIAITENKFWQVVLHDYSVWTLNQLNSGRPLQMTLWDSLPIFVYITCNSLFQVDLRDLLRIIIPSNWIFGILSFTYLWKAKSHLGET